MELLRNVSIFKDFDARIISILESKLVRIYIDPNTTVENENEVNYKNGIIYEKATYGENMYLVESGQCHSVSIHKKNIKIENKNSDAPEPVSDTIEYGPGCAFGTSAIVTMQPRQYTIQCTTKSVLLSLSRGDVLDTVPEPIAWARSHDPKYCARDAAYISADAAKTALKCLESSNAFVRTAGIIADILVQEEKKRRDDELGRAVTVLKNKVNLFMNINKTQMNQLKTILIRHEVIIQTVGPVEDSLSNLKIETESEKLTKKTLKSKTKPKRFQDGNIVKENCSGDSMFIIEKGNLEVCVDAVRCASNPDGLVGKIYGPGEYFGELALLNADLRKATVRCTTNCVLFELHRELLLDDLPDIAQLAGMEKVNWNEPLLSDEKLELIRHGKSAISNISVNGHSSISSCFGFNDVLEKTGCLIEMLQSNKFNKTQIYSKDKSLKKNADLLQSLQLDLQKLSVTNDEKKIYINNRPVTAKPRYKIRQRKMYTNNRPVTAKARHKIKKTKRYTNNRPVTAKPRHKIKKTKRYTNNRPVTTNIRHKIKKTKKRSKPKIVSNVSQSWYEKNIRNTEKTQNYIPKKKKNFDQNQFTEQSEHLRVPRHHSDHRLNKSGLFRDNMKKTVRRATIAREILRLVEIETEREGKRREIESQSNSDIKKERHSARAHISGLFALAHFGDPEKLASFDR